MEKRRLAGGDGGGSIEERMRGSSWGHGDSIMGTDRWREGPALCCGRAEREQREEKSPSVSKGLRAEVLEKRSGRAEREQRG